MQLPAMYNPALFSIWQEFPMAASKKRKKATTSRKKAAPKKVSKKKVAKKKVAKKAVPKKKVNKNRPAKKKVSKKKTSKKKVAKKTSKKKVAKKASKKKVSKKKASKKKVSKKKVSKKKASKKKVSKKKASKKKVSKKKVTKKKVSKKTVSKKKPAKKVAKKASSKKPSKKTVAPKKVVRKTPIKRSRSRGDVLTGPIHGIEPYKTLRGEEYMSNGQQKHFHKILAAWKSELMFEVDRTVHHMQDEAANFPDPNDRATQESEFGLELRTRDRERKLLRKIESALMRVDDGSYGFCDETGEEIGLKRLEARPVATLCLEAQERRELAERQFRDRDDRYR
jgi:DnaK suppressor protein